LGKRVGKRRKSKNRFYQKRMETEKKRERKEGRELVLDREKRRKKEGFGKEKSGGTEKPTRKRRIRKKVPGNIPLAFLSLSIDVAFVSSTCGVRSLYKGGG